MVNFRNLLCAITFFGSSFLNSAYCASTDADTINNSNQGLENRLVFQNKIVAIANSQPLTTFQFGIQLQMRGVNPTTTDQETMSELYEDWLSTAIESNAMLKRFERMKGKIDDKQKHEMYLNFVDERYNGDEKLLKSQLKLHNKSLREMKQEILNNSIISYLYSQNVSSYAMITPFEIKEFYKLNREKCIEPRKYTFEQFEIPNDRWTLQTELISNIDNNNSYIATRAWIADHPEIVCKEHRDVVEQNIREDVREKLKKLNIMQFDRKPIKDGDYSYFFCLKNRIESRLLELKECSKQIENYVRHNKWEYIKSQWIQGVLKDSYIKVF